MTTGETTENKLRRNVRRAGFALVILGVIALVGWIGHLSNNRDKLRVEKEDGYCPKPTKQQVSKGIVTPGQTAILIDTSDMISKEEGDWAFERIKDWAKDTTQAPFLQKLSIYRLPESEHSFPRKSGKSWCIPKQGDVTNWLYEDREKVQKDFDSFLNSLKYTFDDLLHQEEANVSPIVETMAVLVQRYEDIDSFLLVSDMLQNSSLWSYKGETAIPDKAVAECRKISGPGRVRNVYVVYIDRNLAVQDNVWPTDAWQACLDGIEARTLDE